MTRFFPAVALAGFLCLGAPAHASMTHVPPAPVWETFSSVSAICPLTEWTERGTRWVARCDDSQRTRITFHEDGRVLRWAEDVFVAPGAAWDTAAAEAPNADVVRIRRVERFYTGVPVHYAFHMRDDDGFRTTARIEPDGSLFRTARRVAIDTLPALLAGLYQSMENVAAWEIDRHDGSVRFRVRHDKPAERIVRVFDESGAMIRETASSRS